MQKDNFAAIVLGAGQGKRMKSKTSKVLHKIAGKYMIQRTYEMLKRVPAKQTIIVANPKNQKVAKDVLKNVDIAIQKTPLGTADATKVGLSIVQRSVGNIAVLYGDDSAFYKPQTIRDVFKKHLASNSTITFITLKKENPTGLGRIVRENGKVTAIVEEKDATEAQKKIKEINDGLYFFKKSWIERNIGKLLRSPVTGELYVTDLIEIALTQNEKIDTYLLKDESQWHGVNTKEELEAANIKFARKIHFMGIAGSGASAVAQIAIANGFEVTGCDLNPNSPYINSAGIKIKKGHSPKHLKNVHMLVVSPAILKFDEKNLELLAAQKLNIPILTWEQFQGKILQKNKFTIAVTGAYGKSTTTTMVSQILIDQNLDPTCEIGAKVLSWQKNYCIGKSKYYVCEADEYNNNFLSYEPDIALILDIAWDHPDFFKTEKDLISSYQKFVENIKPSGILIASEKSIAKLNSKRSDIKIVKIKDFGKIDLNIIGDFRRENANAALTLAQTLNLNIDDAKKSLSYFSGIGRRLEYKGRIKNVDFWDDYAVQPYTILKTANALADKFKEKKMLLVLEPHTFSRIEKFFGDFVSAIQKVKADKIYITSTYAAREKSKSDETLSKKLVKAIGSKVIYSGNIKQSAQKVIQNLKDYDLILSMGAGNIYKLYDEVKNG